MGQQNQINMDDVEIDVTVEDPIFSEPIPVEPVFSESIPVDPIFDSDPVDVVYDSPVSEMPPPAAPAQPTRGSSRLRNSTVPPPPVETSDRTTRSAAKSKVQPKFKFKLSEKAAAQAPGMSFLGQYDRELDSDEEELTFEEQFILRMPPGEDCEKLRKMITSRDIENEVWFKFKGSSYSLS